MARFGLSLVNSLELWNGDDSEGDPSLCRQMRGLRSDDRQ